MIDLSFVKSIPVPELYLGVETALASNDLNMLDFFIQQIKTSQDAQDQFFEGLCIQGAINFRMQDTFRERLLATRLISYEDLAGIIASADFPDWYPMALR